MRSSKPCARTCCSARKTIKICVDCKPWGYSVDDIKLFIAEAAKGGAKVDGHVQTRDGGQRAIDAGIHVISHGQQLTPEQHAQMAKKGIYPGEHRHAVHGVPRIGGGREARGGAAAKSAWEKGVHDHLLDGHGLLERADEEAERRVDEPRRADDQFPVDVEGGRHPAKDTLKALTINGYKAADVYNERGPIKAGHYADFIAVPGNPLEDIDALRNVLFVMKNGAVFKKDGVIMLDKLLQPRPGERLETTMTLGHRPTGPLADRTHQLLIGGRWVSGARTRIEVRNPFDQRAGRDGRRAAARQMWRPRRPRPRRRSRRSFPRTRATRC